MTESHANYKKLICALRDVRTNPSMHTDLQNIQNHPVAREKLRAHRANL